MGEKGITKELRVRKVRHKEGKMQLVISCTTRYEREGFDLGERKQKRYLPVAFLVSY